jgi:hypothetical protein
MAAALAADGETAQTEPKRWIGNDVLEKCCGGGDIRIRQVYFDNIPIIADPPGVTRGGDNHFFRFRTRLWGEYKPAENITLKGRVVNEFRHYEKPEDSDAWNAMDELVVDKLYLEVTDLLNDKLDIKIGRQDMIYGTGKVILEGTPKDGSRTIYMDAVKLSFDVQDRGSIDVFGIYNQPENDLVLHSEDRDLTGFTPAFDDVTESGAGIYIKDNYIKQLPAEYYYIYKSESDWERMAGTNLVEIDELELNTVGLRLMPKWNDRISANVEVAYQFGERGDQDVDGLMVDGAVSYMLPVLEDMKPKVSAGMYYLSGDDPETADDEGWNPLWARWPQYSELYIYAFDADGAGRWSNLQMPHVDLTFAPCKRVKTKAMVAHLSAPEDNGPGDGDERGWLYVLRNDITIKESLLKEKDKLFGHIILEVLEPGDYYNVDETAYFARWELSYAF